LRRLLLAGDVDAATAACLLVKGVDEHRWKQQAGRTIAPIA
jgi:hypothetical protein